jgi:hypothetical protein
MNVLSYSLNGYNRASEHMFYNYVLVRNSSAISFGGSVSNQWLLQTCRRVHHNSSSPLYRINVLDRDYISIIKYFTNFKTKQRLELIIFIKMLNFRYISQFSSCYRNTQKNICDPLV